MMTVLALLFISGCAVSIKDFQYCALIPGNQGAVCDQFQTANQQILNEAAWESLEAEWVAAGTPVECTPSSTVADLKSEIEKLCSETTCTYEQAQAVKSASENLRKMIKLGEQARFR